MIGNAAQLLDAAEPHGTRAASEPEHRLRLLVVMAQRPAGALPEAWRTYSLIEDAHASALKALRNPGVLRVAIVENGSALAGSANPLRFIEWID
jgi:hypothetical protein